MRSERYEYKKAAKKVPSKRRRTKHKRRGFGRFIFLIVLIAAVAIGGIATVKVLSNANYDDSKSFEKYAKKFLSEHQESSQIGTKKTEFRYGKPMSMAFEYPSMEMNNVDKQVKNIIDTANTDFASNYEDKSKEEKYALLTTYDSYESKDETGSIVMKSTTIAEDKKGKLNEIDSKVNVFTFSTQYGSRIYPIMAFESGYKEKITSVLENYLKENYADSISSKYMRYIHEDNNYENFALTKNGAIFYFDSNTVVDSNEIIAIPVEKSSTEGLFRDKINARNLDPTKPMIALTYDDGPSDVYSNKILDVFEKTGTVATFFELGQNVDNIENSPEILKRMIDLNCEIGSHSYSHPNLFTLSDEQIKKEAELTRDAIKKAAGVAPTVYRPPYGNGDENTTAIFGVPGILWSIDTLDWSYKDADKIVDVIKNTEKLDGKVVLMHSLYDFTYEATEEIVPWLIEEGYQLVTVSEMLMYKYNEDPSETKFYGYNAFYLES